MPIATHLTIQMCFLGESPFGKSGRMTSCARVSVALKIRQSSVESMARKRSRQNAPKSPVGRRWRIVTERFSWLKRVRTCWKESLASPWA